MQARAELQLCDLVDAVAAQNALDLHISMLWVLLRIDVMVCR